MIHHGYKTIELKAPAGEQLDLLIEWLIDESRFEAVVAGPERKAFGGSGWPRVVLSSIHAKAGLSEVRKTARSGFALLVAVRTPVEDLLKFMLATGYSIEGRGVFRAGDDHDPLAAAWDKGELETIVSLASRISDNPLCLFAHDADPIYVLHHDGDERT